MFLLMMMAVNMENDSYHYSSFIDANDIALFEYSFWLVRMNNHNAACIWIICINKIISLKQQFIWLLWFGLFECISLALNLKICKKQTKKKQLKYYCRVWFFFCKLRVIEISIQSALLGIMLFSKWDIRFVIWIFNIFKIVYF